MRGRCEGGARLCARVRKRQCTPERAFTRRGACAAPRGGQAPDGPSRPLPGALCRVGLTRVAPWGYGRHRNRVIGTQCPEIGTGCQVAPAGRSRLLPMIKFLACARESGLTAARCRPTGRRVTPFRLHPLKGVGGQGSAKRQALPCLDGRSVPSGTAAQPLLAAVVCMIKDHGHTAPPKAVRMVAEGHLMWRSHAVCVHWCAHTMWWGTGH